MPSRSPPPPYIPGSQLIDATLHCFPPPCLPLFPLPYYCWEGFTLLHVFFPGGPAPLVCLLPLPGVVPGTFTPLQPSTFPPPLTFLLWGPCHASLPCRLWPSCLPTFPHTWFPTCPGWGACRHHAAPFLPHFPYLFTTSCLYLLPLPTLCLVDSAHLPPLHLPPMPLCLCIPFLFPGIPLPAFLPSSCLDLPCWPSPPHTLPSFGTALGWSVVLLFPMPRCCCHAYHLPCAFPSLPSPVLLLVELDGIRMTGPAHTHMGFVSMPVPAHM